MDNNTLNNDWNELSAFAASAEEIKGDATWDELLKLAEESDTPLVATVEGKLTGVTGNLIVLRNEDNAIKYLEVLGDTITGAASGKVGIDLGAGTTLSVRKKAYDSFDTGTGDIAGTLNIIRSKDSTAEKYTYAWLTEFTTDRTVFGLGIDSLLNITIQEFITGDTGVTNLVVSGDFTFDSTITRNRKVTVSADTSLTLGILSQDMTITVKEGGALYTADDKYRNGLEIGNEAEVEIKGDISVAAKDPEIGTARGGISVKTGAVLEIDGNIDFTNGSDNYLYVEGEVVLNGNTENLNVISLSGGTFQLNSDATDVSSDFVLVTGSGNTLKAGRAASGTPRFSAKTVFFSGTAGTEAPEDVFGNLRSDTGVTGDAYLTIEGDAQILQITDVGEPDGTLVRGHVTMKGSNLKYMTDDGSTPYGIDLAGSLTLTDGASWDDFNNIMTGTGTAVFYARAITVKSDLSATNANVQFSYLDSRDNTEKLIGEKFTVEGDLTGSGSNTLTVNSDYALTVGGAIQDFTTITVEAGASLSTGSLILAEGETLAASVGTTITVTKELSIAEAGGITIDASGATESGYKLIAGYEGIDYTNVTVTGYDESTYTLIHYGNDLYLVKDNPYEVLTVEDEGVSSLRLGLEGTEAPLVLVSDALSGDTLALQSALTVDRDVKLIGKDNTITGPELVVDNGELQLEDIELELGRLSLKNGGVIQSDKSISVRSLIVSGGNSTISGEFSFASGYGPSYLIVERGATLTVDGEQLKALLQASVISITGTLAVTGDLEWNQYRALYENYVISNFEVTGAIRNADRISVSKGASFQLAAASLTGTAGNDSIKLAANSSATLDTDIDLLEGKNSVSIGSNAFFRSGDLLNVSSLKLAAGKAYQNAAGQKVQGWTTARIDGDFSGSTGKNTVSTGKFSMLEIGGDFGKEGQQNSISIGAGSTLSIAGDLLSLRSLKLGNSAYYYDANGNRLEGNATFTAGAVTGTDGNDSVKIGKGGVFTADSLDLGKGKNSFSVGSNAEVVIKGDALSLGNLSLAAGKKVNSVQEYTTMTVGDFSADKISLGSYAILNSGAFTATSSGMLSVKLAANSEFKVNGDFTGSGGGDRLWLAKNSSLHITGKLDLGGGTDAVILSNNAYWRVDGSMSGVEAVKIGDNCLVELNSSAITMLQLMGYNFQVGKNTIIADIGKTGVAENFTSNDLENSDNDLESATVLGNGANGWLSNKADYSQFKCWNDEIDYFTLADATSLDGWQITGDKKSLKVTVWKFNGTEWDKGTILTENNGVWDLSQISVDDMGSYCISVEIGSSSKNAYGYQVKQIA